MTASSLGTSSVTVASDSTAATAAINNFITKYNAVQNTIANQTKVSVGSDGKVSSATLGGNREIGALGASLRKLAFSAVPGADGSAAQRLQSMGIDFVSGTRRWPSRTRRLCPAHWRATGGSGEFLSEQRERTLGTAQ